MNQLESRTEDARHDLTDRDFYTQACSYFYYHAGQRTTMINFFIAVFAAAIALYGTLLSLYVWGSVFVSVFLLVVSFLFLMIDLRNKFDVKESENVIRQIERDYGCNTPGANAEYAYGVFSNETNTFHYYGHAQRRAVRCELRHLRRLYRKALRGEAAMDAVEARMDSLMNDVFPVSREELMRSLRARSILPLSLCIKLVYMTCMVISTLALVLALLLALGVL